MRGQQRIREHRPQLATVPPANPRVAKMHEMFRDAPEEAAHLHDLESETQSIGAMLMLDGNVVAIGMELLAAPMFAGSMARAAFEAISAMHRRALIHDDIAVYIEPCGVGNEMRRMGIFAHWTPVYLTGAIEECPCAAIIRQSAAAVRRCSQLRHQREAARVLASHIEKHDADPQKLQMQMLNALAEIKKNGWCDCEKIFEEKKPDESNI